MPAPVDAVLATALHAGDEDALADILALHGDDVYNYCYRRTGSWPHAESATKAAFAAAWATREDAPTTASGLVPWLYRLATGGLLAAPAVPPLAPGERLPESAVALGSAERLSWALRVLASVPREAAGAWVLSEWEHLPLAQVGYVLLVSPETTRRLLADPALAPDALSPAELFIAPDRQPFPESAADEILSVAANGFREPRRTGHWWLAPALTLTLAAMVFLVSLVLPRVQVRQPNADRAATSVELVPQPGVSSLGKQLVAACRTKLGRSSDPQLRRMATSTESLTAVGTIGVLLYDTSGHLVLCGGSVDRVTIGQVLRPADDGPTATALLVPMSGQDRSIVAGGRLGAGNGTTVPTLTPETGESWNGFWIWTTGVAGRTVSGLPANRGVRFGDTTVFVNWPGSSRGAPSVDRRRPCGDVAGQTMSLVTSEGHAGLVATASGLTICRATDEASLRPAGSDWQSWTASLVTPDADAPATVFAAGGKLPAGASGGYLVTPHGRRPMTVRGGWWVAEDVVDNTSVGVQPARVVATFTGATAATAEVPWADLDQVRLPAGWLRFRTGDPLTSACHAGANQLLVTAANRQVVLARDETSGQLAACLSATTGQNALAFYPDAAPASTEDAFALTSLQLPGQRPLMLVAGGRLPDGVTAAVFHLPYGDVAATVLDGNFLLSAPATAETAKLTTVRVSVKAVSGDRDITVVVHG